MASPKKIQLVLEPEITRIVMTLASSNYSNKILQGLNTLRKEGSLCDYTVTAESMTLKVHKCVMVSCSDYFQAMLSISMRESQESGVVLQGVTARGLQAVVHFAYTGLLELSLDNLEEILAAASHLQVNEAVELCCQYMDLAITHDNCIDFLNLSELFSLPKAQEKARNFIMKNFDKLCEDEHYFKLSNTQLEILLSENKLTMSSEYLLFEYVLQWINHDRANREKYTASLMSRIRLPLLSGEELVEKVSRVEVMKKDKECSELLAQAKDYHIVVSKQPLLQTRRTQVRSDRQCLMLCHAVNLESYEIEEDRHAFLKDATMPMYNPCVSVVDNFMYACGGKYDSNENNEIATARCFRYDPRFDTWFELASMNEARKDFSLVALGNKLYAIAGQDENIVMSSVECFTIEKNEWDLQTSLSCTVCGHAGVACDNLIYISGGQKFNGDSRQMTSYDPVKKAWHEEPSMLNARSNHVMLCVKNQIYVIGGNTEDAYGFPVPTIAVEVFNPSTKCWTFCSSTFNIREAGATVLRDKIYIIGGINGEHYFSDLIQEYDPQLDSTSVVTRFPTRIYGRACCVLILPRYM